MLSEPLLDEAEDDNYKWLRLFATVTAVALGSSLQFGFATDRPVARHDRGSPSE